MFFRVGLGQGTGTGFPGEAVGVLPGYAKWQPIVQANFSFGYGISLTTLQLAQAYSVIASGGEKIPVSLLKLNAGAESTNVVDPLIAHQVGAMLERVIQKGGTGTRAEIPAYYAAGKTGTIHKVGRNGYADDRYLSLFAGYAPANNPRIIAVVAINEPSAGQYFGGEVAAPVFSALMEHGLRILQVIPDYIPQSATQVVHKNSDDASIKREPLS
jgi:cell division protein FtsI (penicillin-binding protein 3)